MNSKKIQEAGLEGWGSGVVEATKCHIDRNALRSMSDT